MDNNTYDNDDEESCRAIHDLIDEYVGNPSDRLPLEEAKSIADILGTRCPVTVGLFRNLYKGVINNQSE